MKNLTRKNSRRSLKKKADDYAIQVLGKKEYAPWLYVYTLVSGSFKEGWIPDNFFGRCVYPKVNKALTAVPEFKTFSNIVFKTDALPDIAYFIDNVFYNRDLNIININDLREIVGKSTAKVFVKQDYSKQGLGIIKLGVNDINADTIKKIGNCVIQSSIKQHDFFEQFISGSVATIRITTVKNLDGKINMRASYLRLGRKDTAWIQSNNSIRAAIVNNDGELDTFGYTQDWKRWLKHPDTDVSFANKRIPQFKQAVETCIKLHALIPHYTIIGWDMTIDHEDKVKLMEWNAGHCDIKFSEATTGPCFTGLNWEKLRN